MKRYELQRREADGKRRRQLDEEKRKSKELDEEKRKAKELEDQRRQEIAIPQPIEDGMHYI
jgi:hypothetical protein